MLLYKRIEYFVIIQVKVWVATTSQPIGEHEFYLLIEPSLESIIISLVMLLEV